MAFDAHANFAFSTVATAPAPATSGTSLTLATGDGALFPVTPFNLVVWPAGARPTKANSEIIRVTTITGDVLSPIVRVQEGSTARTIVVGDQIMLAITAKMLTDIESDPKCKTTVFTASGSFTKDPRSTMIQIEGVGGGNGGGSGALVASGTACSGAAGGSGGGYFNRILPGSVVASGAITVTIGAGGTGGAAQGTNSTAGNTGGKGGTTRFGTNDTDYYCTANPNTSAPLGGQIAASAAGQPNISMFLASTPGGGNNGAAGGQAGNPNWLTGPSGGGGGGISTTPAHFAGGQGVPAWGGTSFAQSNVPGGTAGGGAGGTGNNAVTTLNTVMIGASGGGGGGNIAGNGGAGGNGGVYGAGGGGGGSALNGSTSGAGGNGAAGILIVREWF